MSWVQVPAEVYSERVRFLGYPENFAFAYSYEFGGVRFPGNEYGWVEPVPDRDEWVLEVSDHVWVNPSDPAQAVVDRRLHVDALEWWTSLYLWPGLLVIAGTRRKRLPQVVGTLSLLFGCVWIASLIGSSLVLVASVGFALVGVYSVRGMGAWFVLRTVLATAAATATLGVILWYVDLSHWTRTLVVYSSFAGGGIALSVPLFQTTHAAYVSWVTDHAPSR
ncbi:MAG: hypothetical protein AAGE52_20420 [Myxococcota bacterium]